MSEYTMKEEREKQKERRTRKQQRGGSQNKTRRVKSVGASSEINIKPKQSTTCVLNIISFVIFFYEMIKKGDHAREE